MPGDGQRSATHLETEMRSLCKRPAIALLMASLWIGWAVWANVPHYYDADAMEKAVAAVLGQANVDLQPAEAGFPFAYMRYDYSNSNQLTIHDTELSALLPNILFSVAGTLGVALLVVRVRRVSFVGVLAFCCLMVPVAFMHLRLNGLHPDVISCLYLVPLILLMLSFAKDMIRDRRRQNHEMHGSNGPRVSVVGNPNSVAQ